MASTRSMLGGGSLGTLFVDLTADSTRLVQQMARAENQVKSASDRMARQASVLAAGMVASFAVIGASAVREFAKFDKAMTEAFSIMGKVSDQLKEQMTDLARAMARDSVKSAEDMAKSYFFLASAGLKAEEAMGA